MKTVLITGATGFIGNHVGQKIFHLGHKIKVVTRDEKKARQVLSFPAEIISCDLNTTDLPKDAFIGVDCVIHLAGESVDGRWTEQKKKAILESRTLSTAHLLKNLPEDIESVITASAQGIYGDKGDQDLDENGTPGFGFLPEVCQAWEKPFKELAEKAPKTRVVILRLGMVLSHQGGALRKLISLFQKNIGAVLGDGQQWISWIHIDDLSQIIAKAITNLNYRGIFNAVSDCPVTNEKFTEQLCQHLNVIQAPRVPAFVLRLALGEMSDLVLSSAKLVPKKLKGNDFKFQYQSIEKVFEAELAPFKSGHGFLKTQQYLPYPVEKVFQFFSRAENLESITPELLKFKIESKSTEKIEAGTLIQYSLKIHGVPAKWLTKIEDWNPPHQFVDSQVKGPYSLWHHTHQFEEMGEGTLMTDSIRYKIPFGFLGRMTVGSMVQNDIETIFNYRRQVIAEQTF